MTNQTFKLLANTEFIALDKLLKLMRMVSSGGEAHAVIQEGMVKLNGTVELQKRKKIRKGDRVEFNDQIVEVE